MQRVKLFFIIFLFWFSPASAEELSFKVGDLKRDLILEYPQNSANKPVPLVMFFHGGGGNSGWMYRHSKDFLAMLLKEGYAVAFMNGTGRFLKMHTWNVKYCCGYAAKHNIDDISYIDSAIDLIAEKYLIDENNIFLIGHSNGGAMVYRAADKTTHNIRAAVAVSAGFFVGQEAPQRPFSLLMIHAKNDEILPYEGGFSKIPKMFRTQNKEYMPFEDGADLWAKYLNCEKDTMQEFSDSSIMKKSLCAERKQHWVLTLESGGHAWNKDIAISVPKIIMGFMKEVASRQ